MAIINNVRACLDTYLDAMPELPIVARQNVPYEHIAGTSFFKVNMVPNSTRPSTRGLNPLLRTDGIYSILVCVPESEGPGIGYNYADTLLDYFKATTSVSLGTTTVTIDYTDVGTSFLDSPFYCTPINVVWYTYHQ